MRYAYYVGICLKCTTGTEVYSCRFSASSTLKVPILLPNTSVAIYHPTSSQFSAIDFKAIVHVANCRQICWRSDMAAGTYDDSTSMTKLLALLP